jgi:hypothetical protein
MPYPITEYFESKTAASPFKGTVAGLGAAAAKGLEAFRGGGAREAAKALPGKATDVARAASRQNTLNPSLTNAR